MASFGFDIFEKPYGFFWFLAKFLADEQLSLIQPGTKQRMYGSF